jgi:chorismate mutase/prephenate dehydratase
MNHTKNLSIAYQGIPGSYSHIAASYLYGVSQQLASFASFHEVFDALKSDDANSAVLPIENTIIGSINEVYDLISEYNFHIKSEIKLKIDHNLLAKKHTKFEKIKKIYSHPKAIEQCYKFFKKNARITPEIFEDTAAAAAYVSLKQTAGDAAIASLHAANIYGLEVLKSKIQDSEHNYTRFVVIEKQNNSKKGNKSTLVFVVSHKPGSLVRSLEPFAQSHLNLTHLESRPVLGKPFSYQFYLDFEHPDDAGLVDKIIKEMAPHTKHVKKLGTYTKGKTIEEVLLSSKPSVKVIS